LLLSRAGGVFPKLLLEGVRTKLFVAATGAFAAFVCCSALAYASSLELTPTSLPAAQVGAAYSVSLTASPGSASDYSWNTVQLPDWMTLSPNGSQATLSGTPSQAGSSTFTIQVTDSSGDGPANVSYAITVQKGQPQLTWMPTPAEISFGTGLALNQQLNATAADASGNQLDGSFVYQPPAGTILNAGAMTLIALFTPADTTNYSTATAQATITVDQAAPSIALNDVTAVWGQTELSLNASVTFAVNSVLNPVSGGIIEFTVTDGSGAPVGNQLLANVVSGSAGVVFPVVGLTPGSYTYTANYVPPASGSDFTGASQSANLTVNQAVPAVSWAPGSPVFYNVPVTAALLNATSPLAGSFAYADATQAPVTAGNYAFQAVGPQQVTATFTPADSVHYLQATVTRTIRVLPDRTTVQPSDTSGNPLSPAVWTATFGDASVTLSATVSVSTASALAGIPTQGSVTFTISDSSGVIGSISPAVNGGAGVASGTFSLNNPALVGAGTYHVSIRFDQATLFAASTSAGTLLIRKAAPVLNWASPSAIIYGTALDASQLNATAVDAGNNPLAGSFSYRPPAGSILPAGTGQVLKVSFQPSDSRDYATATAWVTIDVTPAPTTMSMAPVAPPPSAASATLTARVGAWTLVNGGTVSFVISGFCGSASASGGVRNSVAQATISLTGLSAGTCSVTASYSGTSQFAAISSQSFSNALTVSKQVTPTIIWNTPAAISYGTALSSTQLDASAVDGNGNAVPGLFSYSPGVGAILLVGQHRLKVTFTPNDTTDFSSATASVTLEVDPAATSITVAPSTPPHGAASVMLHAFVTSVNTVNGGTVTFTVTNSGGSTLKSATATMSKGGASASVSIAGLAAGDYTISASYRGTAQYLASGPASNTLTIS
jgi:hypothetical protein